MSSKKKFTAAEVDYISKLANIPLKESELIPLADGFNSVIEVIDKLGAVDVKNIPPTHQVTGLWNVLREDVVDEKRMLSQAEALSNAPKTHAGYFVVDAIFEEE